MAMKTYDELKTWLAAQGWPEMAEIAAATGVSINVISKLRDGRVPNPRIKTVEPLMSYARKHRRKMAA